MVDVCDNIPWRRPFFCYLWELLLNMVLHLLISFPIVKKKKKKEYCHQLEYTALLILCATRIVCMHSLICTGEYIYLPQEGKSKKVLEYAFLRKMYLHGLHLPPLSHFPPTKCLYPISFVLALNYHQPDFRRLVYEYCIVIAFAKACH